MAKLQSPDYAELSPYALLRELQALANNEIPRCLEPYCSASGLKAWELLEEAVFYFFRQILMLETIRLGANSLFEHEPEGVVLINRDPNPFALMYECKARPGAYLMSSDDVLRYKDYIRRKRREVKEKQHLDLTHFIIVSCGFRGNVKRRLSQIEAEGVVISLTSAEYMQLAYTVIRSIGYPDVQLLDLRKLFPRGVLYKNDLKGCFGSSALH